MTTPDYYPLTLNSLINACNQKSNRSPVMSLTEDQVFEILGQLRRKGLTESVYTEGSRSERYRHLFNELFGLARRQNAVLCELFLRGSQTPGELNSRAGRMTPIGSAAAAVQVLESLAGTEAGPMVEKLPRKPGQKDNRWAHLFAIELPSKAGAGADDGMAGGRADNNDEADRGAGRGVSQSEKRGGAPDSPAVLLKKSDDERIVLLENEVSGLKREIKILNDRLDGLRKYLDELTAPR